MKYVFLIALCGFVLFWFRYGYHAAMPMACTSSVVVGNPSAECSRVLCFDGLPIHKLVLRTWPKIRYS